MPYRRTWALLSGLVWIVAACGAPPGIDALPKAQQQTSGATDAFLGHDYAHSSAGYDACSFTGSALRSSPPPDACCCPSRPTARRFNRPTTGADRPATAGVPSPDRPTTRHHPSARSTHHHPTARRRPIDGRHPAAPPRRPDRPTTPGTTRRPDRPTTPAPTVAVDPPARPSALPTPRRATTARADPRSAAAEPSLRRPSLGSPLPGRFRFSWVTCASAKQWRRSRRRSPTAKPSSTRSTSSN